LTDFNKYTYLFDKKTETIVLELKKYSFLQANAGTEGSDSEAGDTGEEAAEGPEGELRDDIEDANRDATPDMIARESPLDKS
jgi:hydroxypyruvate isomerase